MRIITFTVVLAFAVSALAQISPDEAYKRLKAREAARKAAETRPSTQASETDSFMGSLSQIESDINSTIRRGDEKLVDACFGNIKDKHFAFSGIVFGIGASPFGNAQAVLVRMPIHMPPEIDLAYRMKIKAINDAAEERTRKVREDHDLIVRSYTNRTSGAKKSEDESNYQAQLRDIEQERSSKLREARSNKPIQPEAEVYLAVKDDILKTIKRGQAIKGEIICHDGQARIASWSGTGDKAVKYADTVKIAADYVPAH